MDSYKSILYLPEMYRYKVVFYVHSYRNFLSKHIDGYDHGIQFSRFGTGQINWIFHEYASPYTKTSRLWKLTQTEGSYKEHVKTGANCISSIEKNFSRATTPVAHF